MTTVSVWAISHPGLDPSVSYPGLSNVDELNRIASNLAELATQHDLFKGTRQEATFSESERELMTAMSDRLRELAQIKLQVMVDCTASGNITQGIY